MTHCALTHFVGVDLIAKDTESQHRVLQSSGAVVCMLYCKT